VKVRVREEKGERKEVKERKDEEKGEEKERKRSEGK
jgi:hypothetical protein